MVLFAVRARRKTLVVGTKGPTTKEVQTVRQGAGSYLFDRLSWNDAMSERTHADGRLGPKVQNGVRVFTKDGQKRLVQTG